MRSAARILLTVTAAASLALATASVAPQAAKADITVVQCDTYQPYNSASTFVGGNNTGGSTQTFNGCTSNPPVGLEIDSNGAQYGYGAWWYTAVPSGWLTIAEAKVWYGSQCVDGMSGEFDWNYYGQNAGHSALCGGDYVDYAFSSPISSFGWQDTCQKSGGCIIAGSSLAVSTIQGVWLDVRESASPSLSAAGAGASGSQNLWYHANGWVREDNGQGWPADLAGGDITGVCRFFVALDGNWLPGTGGLESPDQSQWHQCSAGSTGAADQYGNAQQRWSYTINISAVSNGWHTYQIGDQNAAGNWGPNPSEKIGVDNQPVSVTLSAPSHDVSVTAGTQYVTATASAGPSGVGSIVCRVDGSSWTPEQLKGAGAQSASGRVAVSGLGPHQVSCYGTNRAVDVNNQPATSPTESWPLTIGEPVHAGITFGRVIVHCRREIQRVRGPGRWVRVQRHHKWVRVHRRGRIKKKHVLACHTVTPDRHLARLRYGDRLTVSGSLTAQGIALSHVPVRVLAAPDNGHYRWRTVAVVTTSADGRWTAKLRPGPSRLIQAVYDGGPTTLPATSRRARSLVRAKILLTHVTRHVPWGGAIVIKGRLLGGYIPGRGQQLLQVLDGVGKHLQLLANPIVHPSGRFTMVLLAHGGAGVLRTQIAVATLSERAYPFARGVSPRVWVAVGG